MTIEELEKVPFHFVAHMSMEDMHTTTYESDDGRFGHHHDSLRATWPQVSHDGTRPPLLHGHHRPLGEADGAEGGET